MRAYSPLSVALHEAVKLVVDSGFSRGAWVVYGQDKQYHSSLDNSFKGILKCVVAMEQNRLVVVRW